MKPVPHSAIVFAAFLAFAGMAAAEPPPGPEPRTGEPPGVQMKEYLILRSEMKHIEQRTISEDPELARLSLQIRSLSEQLRQKLEIKLSQNQEYQERRQKLQTIQVQWRERFPMRGPERPRPPRPE